MTASAADVANGSGAIVIPAGALSTILKIIPVDDKEIEAATEVFEIAIELSAAGGYGFAPPANAGNPPKAAGAVEDEDYEIKKAEGSFDSAAIAKDDGTGNYAAPQWLDADGNGDADGGGEHAYPISYVRSRPGADTKVTASIKFTVNGNPHGKYTLKGVGKGFVGGALTFEQEIIIAKGTTEISAAVTSREKLGDKIDNADLSITWTITDADDGEFKTYAGSKNHAYITGVPAPGAFETVLDVGCRNAKGLSPGDSTVPIIGEVLNALSKRAVTDAIFGEFADNSVKRVDKREMKYSHVAGTGYSAGEMLAHPAGLGQCTAWADLLVQALGAQGVPSASTRLDYLGGNPNGFAVRAMPAQGSGLNNYAPGTFPDGFGFHQVVRVGVYPDRIYDPSYGGMEVSDHRAVELVYEDKNITHLYMFATDTWLADPKGTAELVFH